MRPILFGDITQVARFLLTHPPSLRKFACKTVIERAKLGAILCKNGQYDPFLGDGTLAGVVARYTLPPEPTISNPEYRHALITVLRALDG